MNAFVNITSGDGREIKGSSGPLNPRDGKIPDGVRYHVLDVWVDELEVVIRDDSISIAVARRLMEPVTRLAEEGRTKVVKGRARETLEDERVKGWLEAEKDMSKSGHEIRKEVSMSEGEGEDEEWNGFED